MNSKNKKVNKLTPKGDYVKLNKKPTVVKPGKYDRCPPGKRYNKKTGYCESKSNKKRSFMSVLFNDNDNKQKTRRRKIAPKVIKKRPKCPDGYVINHELGLCEKRGKKGVRNQPKRRNKTV